MKAVIITLFLFATTFLSACPYLFSVENRPCTVQGECLPKYTCVHHQCVKAAAKKINESCRSSAECVAGSLCLDAYCDDSAQSSCEQDDDCDTNAGQTCLHNTCICERVCRATCDYPSYESCHSGELCWLDTEENQGFCQSGFCGENEQGENLGDCLDSEVCLEFNGAGSGLCNPMCSILMQDACANHTAPDGTLCCANDQNCEHVSLLWGAAVNPGNYNGLCFDSGRQNEADPCSNNVADNLFCTRGLFCYGGSCVRYCNLETPGAAPACSGGQLCIDIPGSPSGLPYGYCQAQ